MKNVFKLSVMFLLLNIFSFSIYAQNEPKIQVALILDTSSSMDGLIDQAKTQLWSVVNKLTTTKYEGKRPELEIALYEYGNDGLPEEEGYLRLVAELTTDLDKISEDLFALKTNGGSEFCGLVIDRATVQLKWSLSNQDLKLIFIAGNEEFTQGEVNYKKSCRAAIDKDIVINTIFCGNKDEGINTKWKNGADIAEGKYLNIDQNQTVAYIESPFDDKIMELSNELNGTYIAYGSYGKEMSERQSMQDANAVGLNKYAAVNRGISKSSRAYKNSKWDLVDASKDKKMKVEEIEEERLPEEMRGMTKEEKVKYIDDKKEEREIIQNEISELNKKREAYVSKVKKNKAENSTLEDAMIETVKEQAEKKNYKFEK